MKSQLTKLLLLATAYLCVEIATSALRGVSFIVSSSVMFPAYFLLTFFLIKKLSSVKPWKIYLAASLAVAAPYVVLFAPRLYLGQMDVLIRLAGILGGFLFYKANKTSRYCVVGLSVAFIFCFSPLQYGWGHYLNYGSFKRDPGVAISRPLVLTNRTDTVVISQRPGKTYVLDLWNSHCGYCMKEFPHFQALADKYKDDDRVVFYTVDVLEREENPHALRTPSEYGCALPSFACKDDEFLAELQINGVPVVFVIAPDGRVIYRGDFKHVERHIENHLLQKTRL